MKKVLVTGGKGYIGQYIVDCLQQNSCEVYVTSRKKNLDKRCFYMELLDEESISGICKGMDAVIHLATFDERLMKDQAKDALLCNSFATRELYRDAVNQGVKKFIYFSTFHVYGQSSGHISEDDIPYPKNDYGMTHYFAEKYLEQLSLGQETCVDIIRLTNGIGVPKNVDRWYLVLNDFCRTVYETGKVILQSNGLQMRDFVAMQDVGSAVNILLQHEESYGVHLYNVSGEKAYSIRELALKVGKIYEQRYNKEAKVQIPNLKKDYMKNEFALSVSSKNIRDIGWTPTYSVDDVIVDIFSSFDK